MAKNPPPKAAAKRAARKGTGAGHRPRGKRAPHKKLTESEIREKARKLANKADPHSRGHLKTEYDADDVDSLCDLIVEAQVSLSEACKRLGFRFQTFRARMREDAALNKRVLAAIDDLRSVLTCPIEAIKIADKAHDKESAAVAKVQVWARFEASDRMLGGGKHLNLNHGGALRITGLGELLKEISDAGGDVGPGPSRGT